MLRIGGLVAAFCCGYFGGLTLGLGFIVVGLIYDWVWWLYLVMHGFLRFEFVCLFVCWFWF